MIFKADNDRGRLMLELMARDGMRIGEVLKLTKAEVDGKKLWRRSLKTVAPWNKFIFRDEVNHESTCELIAHVA